jgi:hypothetical protein
MTILTHKEIAEWRTAPWCADNDDCADGFRALCDTVALGLRAIAVLDELTHAIWREHLQVLVREPYDEAVKMIVNLRKETACASKVHTTR